MYCLYCGDCCKRFSPIANPCPHLIIEDDFHFCGIYPHRPKECSNHEYQSRFCSIGIDVLKINPQDSDALRKRIDNGWDKIKELTPNNTREVMNNGIY